MGRGGTPSDCAASAHALLVLAHRRRRGDAAPVPRDRGAGLAERGIATFRYEFAYMEERKRRPDPPALARSGSARPWRRPPRGARTPPPRGWEVVRRPDDVRRSGEHPLPDVQGLVFSGFPLHPPGRPGTARADHLDAVRIRCCFSRVRGCLRRAGAARAGVRPAGAAGHAPRRRGGRPFVRVPHRAGRSDADVLAELAKAVDDWSRESCRNG